MRTARFLLATCALALAVAAACVPPERRIPEEDPQLVREVVQQQEQRVARARAELAQHEHGLALVRMRRRMLERAGRYDLSQSLEGEERTLEQRVVRALQAMADEQDALAIYRGQDPRQAAHP